MDLRALQIFKAVVDEGGLTRAAERLHCVQSNVSIRIRQLECFLDTCLFERAGNRLTLTPRGVVLHEYATRLLQLAEEAKMAVAESGTSGPNLRIGAAAMVATVLLPRALTEFHRNHPSARLCVNVATTDNIVRSVLEQRIDIGLVVGEVSNAALQMTEIHEDELILVTDLKHRRISEAKDLRSAVILGFRDSCTYRNRISNWMAESGVPRPKLLELDTTDAIVGFVTAGFGAAILPRGIIESLGDNAKIRCHHLPDKYARIRTIMIWRADSRQQYDPHLLAGKFRAAVEKPGSEPVTVIVEP